MSQLDLVSIWAVVLLALAATVTMFARRASMADSPWFWVCVFSMAATVALFVMDGKYNHRQGHIEDEYRFGTRTLQRPSTSGDKRPSASGQSSEATLNDHHADAAESNLTPLGNGPQPATHELLISLAPLRFLAIATMIVSWIALQWRRVREARGRSAEG
jgi:uncharacterized membrane protein YhaH (DUF805 family)